MSRRFVSPRRRRAQRIARARYVLGSIAALVCFALARLCIEHDWQRRANVVMLAYAYADMPYSRRGLWLHLTGQMLRNWSKGWGTSLYREMRDSAMRTYATL